MIFTDGKTAGRFIFDSLERKKCLRYARVLHGGGGGGFFLACEDFGRILDNSFPACFKKKKKIK